MSSPNKYALINICAQAQKVRIFNTFFKSIKRYQHIAAAPCKRTIMMFHKQMPECIEQ